MKTFASDPDEPVRELLFVGMSDYEVVNDGTTLVAYGLGACVGLAIYDPENGVGGLARSMLPHQSGGESRSDGKYVDAAVETMVREAISMGASYAALEGYIVGGSEILDLRKLPRGVSEKNIVAAREEFANLDVPVEGTDVGGTQGRTVEVDTETGSVAVFTAADSTPALLRDGEETAR